VLDASLDADEASFGDFTQWCSASPTTT